MGASPRFVNVLNFSRTAFHTRCLRVLTDAGIRFMVGGGYALRHHASVFRDPKDLDVFLLERDIPAALRALSIAGFDTSFPFPHWLAKAFSGEHYLDLIFSSGNGVARVDEAWFAHAAEGSMFGVPVAIAPAEETLWSKAFVMERERFDGADVAHIIARCGDRLDWDRILARFGEHWHVLLSHIVMFRYAFPSDACAVPSWVVEELTARLASETANEDKICRGTLVSREQYLPDIADGYRDARLSPHGNMSEEHVRIWTDAIEKK